jgi:hypothetical protein
MLVDKRNMLQDATLELEVWHEMPMPGTHGHVHQHSGVPHVHVSGKEKEEKARVGIVRMNLAEYVRECRDIRERLEREAPAEDAATKAEAVKGVTRRYLLQDSKVNCTLKVMIDLKQTEGDDKYDAPALRMDPGFSGITGLMRDANDEADELAPLTKTNRSVTANGQTDDMTEAYRQTLAAELLREPGQPSAEEVIEDIFSGGNGWTKYNQQIQSQQPSSGGPHDDAISDGEGHKSGLQPNKRSWPDFARSASGTNLSGMSGRRLFPDQGGTTLRSQGGQASQQHHGHHLRRNSSRSSFGKSDDPFRIASGLRHRSSFARSSHGGDIDGDWMQVPEVDEFDMRDDLRCWNPFK